MVHSSCEKVNGKKLHRIKMNYGACLLCEAPFSREKGFMLLTPLPRMEKGQGGCGKTI